ncbi:hypothetical protein UFOVP244_67 [uncultured Caudovirales phage]|uniref:Uncharacterized protein n=1 Tax=uncultured Caudovirales phage TaxID=2100421 RepID=A0A6J7WSP7_9CAUD|nr:hypothetical protein UFOVP244_67 [uncultured Caudovirales phage]
MANSSKTLNIIYKGSPSPELLALLGSTPKLSHHKDGMVSVGGVAASRLVATVAWTGSPSDFESFQRLEQSLRLLKQSGVILEFSVKM